VRRRIYVGGAAITAASLAVFVGTALAASPSKAARTVVFRCHVNLTTEAPPGQQAVDIPASQGTQYGPAHCGKFGGAVQADSFKVPDSGDMVGGYKQYFLAGTVQGKFDLQPLTGLEPSATTFESQDWAGTVTVTGGTGTWAKVAGKNGTLKCTSPDSVHLHCVERIKLTVGS
jgi:hypothetical protein